MSRISKDPLVRQAELMDAAEELFLVTGYQATMVQDIVKKVGVAQGTFYYHFSSKDTILEAIFIQHFQQTLSEISISHREKTCPLEKLQLFITLFYEFFDHGKPGTLANILYKENLGVLINQLWRKIQTIAIPFLIPLIEECNQQGFTQVEHMDETIAFFIGIIASLLESTSPLVHGHESNREVINRKINIAEKLLETLFCAPVGSLRFTTI